MTLHLTATTIEEKALKEYLEQTVSEELADKINNGVPVEKDGKKLISKTMPTGFPVGISHRLFGENSTKGQKFPASLQSCGQNLGNMV